MHIRNVTSLPEEIQPARRGREGARRDRSENGHEARCQGFFTRATPHVAQWVSYEGALYPYQAALGANFLLFIGTLGPEPAMLGRDPSQTLDYSLQMRSVQFLASGVG